MALRAEETPERDTRPWAIYARLSKAQDGGLDKVEHQVRLCRKHAEDRGLSTDAALVFIDDSLSAWKKSVRRPGWDRLMAVAGRGEVAGILVFAVDRFTRRPRDLEALIELADEHGVAIDGPRSGRLDLTTATGRQQARWMALQAAAESDNTSERIKATLGRKMRDGKPMGAGRSYGFEVGGTEQRPDEVAVIREVARRMLAGEAVMAICRDLNERGERTSRGGAFNSANLVRLMVRPRNGGHVEHQGRIVGTIPGKPILDEDTYDNVVALVSGRRRGRRASGRYLLTGLARCGRCGRAMNGNSRHKDGRTRRVYICAPQRGGCTLSISADETDAIVAEAMMALLADTEAMAGVIEEEAHLGNARAEHLARVDAVEEQLAELEVKYAAGEIVRRAYERAKPVLDKRLAKERAALDGLAHGGRSAFAIDPSADWAAMTPDEQRALIGAALGVTIMPSDGTQGRMFDPSRVVIDRPGQRKRRRTAKR
jgi:site-specific DNA recombinase